MPRRSDLRSVLILGPGPAAGSAGVFDDAGSRACRALQEEGLRVILVNPDPAAVMTDPGTADAVYLDPVTPAVVEKILRAEKPDALLAAPGGRTALEVAAILAETGLLERHGARLVGVGPAAIRRAGDAEEFRRTVESIGMNASPVAAGPERAAPAGESPAAWREFELQVLRDRKDNAVVVATIEHLEPAGIHPDDSIAVIPAQTLSDREFQELRDDALAVVRAVGVEAGGAGVRFAVNPADGRRVVVGITPGASRGSALAGRATGVSIAGIAARLAVGCTLDEIANDLTGTTRAAFEPSLDYCAVRIPRRERGELPGADPGAGDRPESAGETTGQAIGEAMGIGRTFAEAFLKALASLDIPGQDDLRAGTGLPAERGPLLEMVARATWRRPFEILQAFRVGVSPAEMAEATGIDRWFLDRLEEIVSVERAVAGDLAEAARREDLETCRRLVRAARQSGLSDREIARLAGDVESDFRAFRRRLGILPAMKAIDGCAAEFPARAPCLYSTWETEEEGEPLGEGTVVVLGPGPARAGQGIELDWCCVQACRALREEGFRVITINCNPESISTGCDASDRLYFEPLTVEHVLDVLDREMPRGVIVQFGGETSLRLAGDLQRAGARILGTPPDAVERAEDRNRFKDLLELLLDKGVKLALESPRPVGEFPEGAIELEVDAVSDGREVLIGAIMERIEAAGIGSGDAAGVTPPFSVGEATADRLAALTREIALELGVTGLLNVRFAVRDESIRVLGVTPRASRTVPFAAKATGLPLAGLAARVMAGRTLAELGVAPPAGCPVVCVRKPVPGAERFSGEGAAPGPETMSSGAVMGRGSDFGRAYAMAQLGSGEGLPAGGAAFLSVRDADKRSIVFMAGRLREMGFRLLATGGTARFLRMNGIPAEEVRRATEASPNVLDLIRAGGIQLVIDIPVGGADRPDDRAIRRAAGVRGIPLVTTIAAATAAVGGIEALRAPGIGVAPLPAPAVGGGR